MKKILVLLMVVALSIMLFGCGDSEETDAPDSLDKVYTMKLGTPTSNDPQVYEMNEFKRIVEEKTDGRISVEIYPSGQLGSNTQMLQGLQAGSIEGLYEPTAFLGGFTNPLTVVDLPYFFDDVWSAVEILNSDKVPLLHEYLEEKGICIGSFYPYGDRITLLNTNKKVEKIEDFKGLTIRVMGAKVLQDQFNSWGATGIPMDVPELYTAQQQGTIDGQESASQFFEMGKYYEVAKYILLEPKGAEVTIFMINKEWLDSLPEDLQAAVREAAVEVQPLAAKYSRETEQEARKIMQDAGIEIYEASEEFQADLKERAKTVHDTFLKDNPEAQDIYDELQQLIVEFRKTS